MIEVDQLQRFIFENLPIRGEVVRLQHAYQEVSERHPYPLVVKQFLGQTLVASSLLSATLKYQGSLILQIQGDGPISLLLAQATAEQHLRGLANWDAERNISEHFATAVGKGHLVITIDPGIKKERYQGVVSLEGDSLARIIENYFQQSEQLDTFILLASNETTAAGFLLQLLPEVDPTKVIENKAILWEHILQLAQTLTSDELLNLPNTNLLHRLFHEEDLRLFAPETVQFICHCSRDKMAKAIFTLGHEDAIALLKQHKIIEVTCEFCRKQHQFNASDVETIFKEKP